MSFFDIIGTIGTICIIYAYWMLQTDRISSKSFYYSFLNFMGSSLIIISLLNEWNLSAFLIEFFWAAISLYSMLKKLTKEEK